MGPQADGKIGIMPAEPPVPRNAAGKANIAGGDQPRTVRSGIFFPQAGVNIQHSILRQSLGQDGVKGVQSLHNHHTVGAVDMLGLRGGQLGHKVKDRRIAHAGLGQLLQAVLHQRDIQRFYAFVIIPAIRLFGVAALAHKKVVQAQYPAAHTFAAHGGGQLVGAGGFARSGRPRQHDNTAAGCQNIGRGGINAALVLLFAQLHQISRVVRGKVEQLTPHHALGGARIHHSWDIGHRTVSLLPCVQGSCQNGRYILSGTYN